ncbi:transcription factor 19 [Carassius gibelio]|uniref:transcription factor 19 n=1 Tax=Carassius gibelio TaxID=101364 RepID=UPI002278F422|nr:transcription factor 19 [Carassius gibelio]XP_052389800.1 transcription factor 19 [Carassius gibelio]XP_052389801.1 transcription factor 19 [Carassius gibelio]
MSLGVQPCFQLLRIGLSDTNNSNTHGKESSDSVRDLYTFRPALAQCVFRLGRAPELCDVTLESTIVSRIHAELHVEREADASGEESWKVQVKDRSSHGTWVNEMHLQQGVLKEIFDGDTLTIGGQSGRASTEFYFLFQKVRVHPLDFDAITVPKAGSFSLDIKNRIRTCSDRKPDPGVDISKLSINRATVILNSIGSLSKMNGSCWTFKKSEKTSPFKTPVFSALAPPTTPPPFQTAGEISSKSVPPSSKSRRKSAHTVLLEDDSSDDPSNRRDLEDGRRGQAKKRRRLYKSESEVFQPPLPKLEQNCRSQYDVSNVPPNRQFNHIVNISSHTRGNGISLTPLRQQKSCLSGPGRRPRANSSPIFTTLGMGSENYNLTSPSARMPKTERARGVISRFQASTGRRRGRPRKHPLPQPSLPSPSSSSSSSSTSSSSSSSSSSSEEDDEEMAVAQGVEPCAAAHCRLPQQDTVQWIQCDDCDAWYHLDCLPHNHNRASLLFDPNADFHCGCHRATHR